MNLKTTSLCREQGPRAGLSLSGVSPPQAHRTLIFIAYPFGECEVSARCEKKLARAHGVVLINGEAAMMVSQRGREAPGRAAIFA